MLAMNDLRKNEEQKKNEEIKRQNNSEEIVQSSNNRTKSEILAKTSASHPQCSKTKSCATTK